PLRDSAKLLFPLLMNMPIVFVFFCEAAFPYAQSGDSPTGCLVALAKLLFFSKPQELRREPC
ncbi:MAG: hypothetical protein ACI3YD_06120, partial [Alloprevotella sp.]